MSRHKFDFNWDLVKVFLQVSKAKSMASAARSLNKSQSTLSRHIATLEQQIGVDLFERTSTGLQLTETGKLLFNYAQKMETAATDFSIVATKKSKNLKGKVVISAPEFFAALMLPSAVQHCKKLYPEISLEIQSSREVANLIEREADIAIRGFRPEQQELITKKLLTGRGNLYASPSYLSTHLSNPTTLTDLQNATFINHKDHEYTIKSGNQHFIGLNQEPEQIHTSSDIVAWELVKKGLGIGFMLEEIGDSEPAVMRVLPQLPPLEFELWIVAHRELRTVPRLKAVFDCIVQSFTHM